MEKIIKEGRVPSETGVWIDRTPKRIQKVEFIFKLEFRKLLSVCSIRSRLV